MSAVLRGSIQALVFAFALCVSGFVPTLSELVERSCEGAEHADSDDCSDCGEHCAPGCSDCHCAFPRALVVNEAAHEPVLFAFSVVFAPVDSQEVGAPALSGIFRPPRS